MSTFRLMLRGEDGLLFCYANNIVEGGFTQDIVWDEAARQYPCAEMWWEVES